MRHGRCAVCGVVGRGNRDFICERCGEPRGIVLYCRRCRRADRNVSMRALDVLYEHTSLDVRGRTGVTVALSCCSQCSRPDEPTTTKVYTLRAPVRHDITLN